MSDEFDANVVKTLDETDKKCPACGGTMDFDPKTGGLLCPYCGHMQEIKADAASADEAPMPSTAKEIPLEEAEKTANCDWGTATKTIICKSCGAESVYDAQVLSSECPYCGSNQVTEAGDTNTMAPGGVVPFKIDQNEAGSRFGAWIKKKFFCPKAAKESANPKKFQGIYLPYWTFDADTKSTYTADYGIDRTEEDKEGKSHTVTDWHKTSGSFNKFYNDELVCGTTQHDTTMLRCIEPFDTEDNKAYKPEYVAGFGAEKYSIGVKDAWETGKKQIDDKIESEIRSKILEEKDADRVRNLNVKSAFSNLTFKYLLLPVWISSFKYQEKVYQFMVNGQTGKVYGKTPVSKIKVFITILLIVAIFALLLYFNR